MDDGTAGWVTGLALQSDVSEWESVIDHRVVVLRER